MLTHVVITSEIYKLKLSEPARAILALALTFEDGLTASNSALMEFLGKSETTVSDAICKLEKAELIVIKNRQSKYRVIEFNNALLAGNPVSTNPLLTEILGSKNILLAGNLASTYRNPGNVSKEKKLSTKNKDRFRKPTVSQIQEYARSISYNINAEKFYESYEAKGWMIGKTKMKDWKAAVRTWKNNEKEYDVKNFKGAKNDNRRSKTKNSQQPPTEKFADQKSNRTDFEFNE